jgi:hypothetical protein
MCSVTVQSNVYVRRLLCYYYHESKLKLGQVCSSFTLPADNWISNVANGKGDVTDALNRSEILTAGKDATFPSSSCH